MKFEVLDWENGKFVVKMTELNHIPDICVHLTTLDRVESILKNGLIPGSLRNTENGVSHGVYLAKSLEILQMDCMDDFSNKALIALQVDVTSFKHKLIPDPEWRSTVSLKKDPRHMAEDLAWYSTFIIEPRFIVIKS